MEKTLRNLLTIGTALYLCITLSGCGTYNNLVTLDEGVKESWSQVDTQLQRRFDLIPNLVETVKGFATQEKEVFIGVTEARSKVAGAGTVPQKSRPTTNSPRP